MSRQAVLSAVRVLTADGWPASVREIAEKVGTNSMSSLQRDLHSLEDDGFLERHPRRPNGGWMPGLRRGDLVVWKKPK